MRIRIYWWHGKDKNRNLTQTDIEDGIEYANIGTMENLRDWALENDVRVMPIFSEKGNLLAITRYPNFNQR